MPLPPLLDPVDALPPGEAERASRQLRLPEIGEVGQRRLAAARIAVVGAGGLGSPVLQYLASAGVGRLGIIDFDRVESTNLQRQVLFGVEDVGRPKAEVAVARLAGLSPHTDLRPHLTRLDPTTAPDLLADYDLVIDGTDTFATRYAIADACEALGIPLVWGSVLRFDAQATVFWSAPTAGPAITLRDVFPSAPDPALVPSCAEAGVIGALCGQLGAILAMEAIKLICGIGDSLLGRMLVLDALGARTREVPLTAAERSRPIPRVDVAAAEREGALFLDVREDAEVTSGMLPGALHIPLARVLTDPAQVPVDRSVVVYCQRGPRSRVAAHALAAAHPRADIRVLAGGYGDVTPVGAS
ncbi:molybdopterin-synthase adenylyltransferase [Brachybacterium endophyticum]|uniref:Molybdopterin-synthase adenylyltransferase n=1 Tax=Brachybacterium endophyticum TaxID=2182385 RepID=A0A2U2RI93_9MICO|nr:ThiF family adenylyltransferase [Brachybacterium endophyticum]PWH05485.1 molybdopterin-synthase adenylyltransferase [Brachybacterium endophyticum]